ncbi:nucleolar protein dao-5-like [Chelonus insularis]|uniref:nucleolar protein dao-5-like n=1 Tax=Chelonus insularis TaxID=460826 RepID=UPI00158DF665|nr:nucleolar protein dao-5-like [Chelonus insularis]
MSESENKIKGEESQSLQLDDFDVTHLNETGNNEDASKKEKDLSSPLKRTFDLIGNKKSDLADSDDEPASKLVKISSETTSETQQSKDEKVDETPKTIVEEKRSILIDKKIDTDSDNESTTKSHEVSSQIIPETPSQEGTEKAEIEENINVNSADKSLEQNVNETNNSLSSNKEDNESFETISQTLENILNDGNKMEIDHVKEPDGKTEQIDKVATTEIVEKENTTNDENGSDKLTDTSNKNSIDENVQKSRKSIEVVYDKSLAPPPKPKEFVELDEDGEKIVLDSSQEDADPSASVKSADNNTFKSSSKTTETTESKMTNGGSDSNRSNDSDRTTSLPSDLSESTITGIISKEKIPEVLSLISDSEGESFISEDKSKMKTLPVEKEINVLLKVKCLLHIDETSKELAGKEVLAVYCENISDFHSSSRRRNSDTSNMADISDNKDPASPGSVTSNPQPFPLPSRLSVMSYASSSSTSSSGSSKSAKDNPFSLPQGVPKHAKKLQDHVSDEFTEKLKKEWKNINLISSTVINFINSELMTTDLHNGTNDQGDNILERFRSSTPETVKTYPPVLNLNTSMKKATKRTRNQNGRPSKSNGMSKASSSIISNNQESVKEKKEESKVSASPSTPSRPSGRSLGILRSYTPVYDPSDALIGKKCFAKWSDNNYYPGTVVSKSKSKFKINFLDGKNKLLIEDFIIPTLSTLPINLSVYATTKNDDYGSCGIITDIEHKSDDDNDPCYAVETDEGEKLKVQIKDIFLTADQAQILKEIINEDSKDPSTPHAEKMSLDNNEELRKTKSTPAVSTPKSSKDKARAGKSTSTEPSVSGTVAKVAYEDSSETDAKTDDNENTLGWIQPEITGTSNASSTKGPQNRVKGKGRSKKKVDSPETINLLGPIPEDSNLFKGMSFILTCAPMESLDKYKSEIQPDSNSELGTDYEVEWTRKPFIRERLTSQIIAGGGKIYETFEEIPKEEYKSVKLITNVPNITAKSLLCLSVGITPYSHQWVIRCCQENKLLDLSSDSLPAGWSLEKKSYVEMHKRSSNLPFQNIKVIIPKTYVAEQSLSLWQKVIENAGGIVQLIENPSDNFIDGVAVLTNRKCPSWVLQKAEKWNIPLVSSTWITQCLIEGELVPHDSQQAYLYNYYN